MFMEFYAMNYNKICSHLDKKINSKWKLIDQEKEQILLKQIYSKISSARFAYFSIEILHNSKWFCPNYLNQRIAKSRYFVLHHFFFK